MFGDWFFWVSGALLGLGGLILLGWSLFADRPRGRRRCPKCWYDMSGVTGKGPFTCPECGKRSRSARNLRRTRRRWLPAAFGLFAMFGSGALFVAPKARRDGELSIVPASALIVSIQYLESATLLNEVDRRTTTYIDGACFGMTDAESLREWQWRMLGTRCAELATHAESVDVRREALWIIWDYPYQVMPPPPEVPHAVATLIKYGTLEDQELCLSFLCEIVEVYPEQKDALLEPVVSLLDRLPILRPRIQSQLVELACCDDDSVRKVVIPSLIDALETDDAALRYVIIDALACGACGDFRDQILATFERHVSDEEEFVRDHARRWIEQIRLLE